MGRSYHDLTVTTHSVPHYGRSSGIYLRPPGQHWTVLLLEEVE